VDICILAVLILLNGLLSLSEMAVVTVSINKVKLRAEHGDKKCVFLKNVKENASNFLSTIQIGISFLSILTGVYAADVFAEPVFTALKGLFPGLGDNMMPLVFFITTVVISYFSLVFGELVPKRLAISKSMEISREVVGFIAVLSVLFKPFIKILSFSTDIILKLFRIKETADEDITEEEIRMMVDASSETGGIDESELEMINNVFEFDDTTAAEILTHRTKLAALPVDCDINALINIVNERFSRIPVYEENIDNIIGILYTRDLLEYIIKERDIGEIDIRKIMRKPCFVHESKKTDELFKQMQKDKQHMSVVVDEYGGTVGIVTMEDLVEEIMGNIQDEFDDEEFPDIEHIDKTTYLINGTLNLSDVADFFKTTLPHDEYDTLSGFFIGQIGRIPEENERPEIIFGGIIFKVYEMEEKRIKAIIASKIT